MKRRSSKPDTIQDLLEADQQQLSDWSGDLELEAPVHLETEEQMVEIWLSGEHSAKSEHEETSTTIVDFVYAMLRPAHVYPLFSALALCCVVFFGIQWMGPPIPPQLPRVAHVVIPRPVPRGEGTSERLRVQSSELFFKGKAGHTGPKDATLHLGVREKDGRLRRIAQGARCYVDQSVLFGFTLRSSGYLYLFARHQQKRLLLLYPTSQRQLKQWPRGFSNFEIRGVAQEYSLRGHRGALRFSLVKVTSPLTAVQIKAIKAARDLAKALRRWQHQTKRGTIALAQFHLLIKSRP